MTVIIICAYADNRFEDTLAAAASCLAQDPPPAEVLVVVDHNPILEARLAEALPRCRVMANARNRGLSGGRNTGIAATTAPLIGFLDDDATADPGWLARLSDWCTTPGVLGAGGLSTPVWSGQRPAWLPEEFLWVVGCSYRGMPDTLTPVRNPMGGCMVVRRSVFDTAGGFHEGLGRGASHLPISCEETEFCIRAAQVHPGARFLFDPGAVIRHRVNADRLSWAYFAKRCYAEGISKAFVASLAGRGGLAAERGHAMRTLPAGVMRGLGDTLRGRFAGAARSGAIVLGLAAAAAGYARGGAAVRRQGIRMGRMDAHAT